jgi:hypothetical protein
MLETRIAHLLALVFDFLRGHVIFFYLHIIIFSLVKVFFLGYRLILHIESAAGLFLLLRKDLWLLGMNVLVAWNSFDYIHFLGVHVRCGFLEACSFISSLLVREQLHDIVI